MSPVTNAYTILCWIREVGNTTFTLVMTPVQQPPYLLFRRYLWINRVNIYIYIQYSDFCRILSEKQQAVL